ncbi:MULTISPECIES: ATP-binding protein [unclassified Brevundimonas]|uniref:ATP-binding protein n=1 Tax=unclassified Brevundimonas TaxID=2622653 RepID=UPI000CFBAE3D|nr:MULTISPECIES: ATP-binding protein [unclassified Brevundimonas]PRA31763.1 hybrid sensor histidine kinase/response regulator [Brevundimonas sp. MYb27]PQZ83688.1 hybrid sensor histidine kinase/response regulator [Brevundimonas sp. MYb31]PRB15885.1 hybrid sensor histidine kinase/response regulator [Brevundimonas sp. MYb52]PRB36380.1 hybrid sensor histidine kinase/response regulator [Brevundimonas sp. MYb46]PRB46998.1 hybrid sensor histidine kinase/response regulator [Brevundimonas sp. MYb33]
MTQTAADAPTIWAPAIRQRRKAMLQRIVMGAATALVFSPMLGWRFSAIWLVIYTLIQFLEAEVFRPVVAGAVTEPAGWRGVYGDLVLILNAGFFGVMAVPLWVVGGAMGGVAASVLLSAGMINSVIMSAGSMRIFACTVLPQLAIFALTPLFMARMGAAPHIVTAVSVAILSYTVFCLNTRRHLFRANRAETEARIEADRKRAEAEAVMASRGAFLAAVAHDLRTPISAILTGAAELDRGDKTGSSSRQQVALITDAGLMMKDLLDDLLDHARLDAGRMNVESRDFDLRLLLSQTARLWAGPARAKGLRLRMEGARTLPGMVRGDAMRLRQVLNNLISNAMKFTDAGSITLGLQSWPDEHGAHVLLINVADTGPGMSVEQLARLFTPFDQTADGVAALYGGSGLGLAISRDLTELMGGRLTVRSAPGQGAVFTISLVLPRGASADIETALTPEARGLVAKALSRPTPPLPPSEPETVEPAPTVDEASFDERPLRVLVVDDHAINRRAIQLILQSVDCEIAMAEDGLAALDACNRTAFDVVFMDVRMPELDGRETTRRLRAGGGLNAAVPVIAVTADTAPEDIAACTAAGMNYFVSKPLTPGSLLGALSQVLEEAAVVAESAAA